jgi:hypothetical protein
MKKAPTEICFYQENGSQFIPVHRGSVAPYDSYEDVRLSGDALPIADTTTLPGDFYDTTSLDIRYARDARRVRLLGELNTTDEAGTRAKELFGQVGVELKALLPAYDADDAPWSSEELARYLGQFNEMTNYADTREYNRMFYGVPRPLRNIAATDLDTFTDMMRYISALPNVNGLADASAVAEYMDRIGVTVARGGERMTLLAEYWTEIVDLISFVAAKEEEIITTTDPDVDRTKRNRIFRKRYRADSMDSFEFKSCTQNGVIVNPYTYLTDDSLYEALHSESPTSFYEASGFMRHMIAGTWAFSHDHTLLYRNSDPEISAVHDAVLPDYGAIRPGNFLYHDFKLLEHGPHKYNFPTDVLAEYIRLHYFDQVEMQIIDKDSERSPFDQSTFGQISFEHDGARYAVPLRKVDDHVIPFRALKKDFVSDEYFEYDESCYLAELVDMSMELDVIDALKAGRTNPKLQLGNTVVERHTANLLVAARNKYGSDSKPFTTIAKQVLFMDGKEVACDDETLAAILAKPVDYYGLIPTVEERENGVPVGPRQPLTGSYEWFMRKARPVSREELQMRGVPYKPALFVA